MYFVICRYVEDPRHPDPIFDPDPALDFNFCSSLNSIFCTQNKNMPRYLLLTGSFYLDLQIAVPVPSAETTQFWCSTSKLGSHPGRKFWFEFGSGKMISTDPPPRCIKYRYWEYYLPVYWCFLAPNFFLLHFSSAGTGTVGECTRDTCSLRKKRCYGKKK